MKSLTKDMFRLAADIGGTFTDLALTSPDGSSVTMKLPSTPDDYGRAIVEGTLRLCRERGIGPAQLSQVLHGCTIATNAILENAGARTALITTRGFRDVLELRRIRVPRLYEPLYQKPAALAPRNLRLEVDERIGPRGEIITALDQASVVAAIDKLRKEKVEAIAVCLLHSYANPAHERRIGEALRAAFPECFVTLSVDILPEIREYERTSTTVINSYVGPVVRSYVDALQQRLKSAGITAPVLVMQSSGGILDAAGTMEMPARIVECGPAAGVIGAAWAAQRAGYRDVITFDMGGTTAKASLIEAGQIAQTDEYEVGGGISLSSKLVKGGGYALKLPVIDISEVGAGGGSIVWLDRAGGLKVGPRSAGAVPGPACYGAGGTAATVTDANVVLGSVSPIALAGGTVPIDARIAARVMREHVATPLRQSLDESAFGVFAVATANMMRALKAVSTYRGRDPRDFALCAFGGNGGIFAAFLARELGITRVLVPPAAGVLSAIGLLVSDKSYTQSAAFLHRTEETSMAVLRKALAALQAAIVKRLGSGRIAFEAYASMRYAGQAFELRVAIPPSGSLARLSAGFETEHERTYGHSLHGEMPTEFVNVSVVGRLVEPGRQAERLTLQASREAAATRTGSRSAYFGRADGRRATPVIARAGLSARPRRGPLIIEEYEGTTVVPPGARAHLDRWGNIIIALEPR